MKLILHLGPAKTGSTSIQETLRGYDDGVTAFFTFGNLCSEIDSPELNSSKPIRFIFDDIFFEDTIKKLGLSNENGIVLREKFKNMLTEALTRTDRNQTIVSGETIKKMRPSSINALKEYFDGIGCDVFVVYWYRNFLDKAKSLFQQRVKNSIFHIKDFKQPESIQDDLRVWSGVFGKEAILVRSFNKKHLKDECVVRDFLSLIGNTNDNLEISKDSNMSMSLDALKIIYFLNQHMYTLNSEDSSPNIINKGKFNNKIMKSYKDSQKLDPFIFSGVLDGQAYENEWKFLLKRTTFQPEGYIAYLKNNSNIKNKLPKFIHSITIGFKRIILHKKLISLKNIDFSPVDKLLEVNGFNEMEITNFSKKDKVIKLYNSYYPSKESSSV